MIAAFLPGAKRRNVDFDPAELLTNLRVRGEAELGSTPVLTPVLPLRRQQRMIA